jgi:hypothetical protein
MHELHAGGADFIVLGPEQLDGEAESELLPQAAVKLESASDRSGRRAIFLIAPECR